MKQKKIYIPEKGCVDFLITELPEPAPGEVQVEVHASLISPGTERAVILNLANTAGVYPLMETGYCTAGIIKAVGGGVSGFKPGDRVATQIGHCSVGNIDQKMVYHLPDSVTFEEGAFTLLVIIAMQAVRKARVELGENVFIFGAGIIGQLAMQIARASGAYRVVIADRVPGRLELAIKNGADGALDTEEPVC